MADPALDLGDIQGLVVRGYGSLPVARYLVCAVEEPMAARAWLGGLAGRLDDARERPERLAVNVAFTPSGLERLGVPARVLASFPAQFTGGMADEHRARLLGDVDESAPSRWDWGSPGAERIDLALLVYAASEAALADAVGELVAPGAGVRVVRELETARNQPREHFGFRDGVSQPRIAGLGDAPSANTIRAGEFLLGYPNEYGLLPDGPTAEAGADPGGVLPAAAGDGGMRDLGRNGSFLVMRQLAQDVLGFWEWCEAAGARPDGGVDEGARIRLASKLVGRWPSGAPLVLAPDGDAPQHGEANDFAYHREDRHGLRCPIGAHIRRAHPRDSLDPEPGTLRSVNLDKRHRLLRRGREYGPPVDDVLGEAPADDPERGLYFICLAANISRQFEFVQHTWVNNPKFDRLYDEPDPLVGYHPDGAANFSMPSDPVRQRVTSIPQFVTTRGGAYFFLPGIRALKYLASLSS